MIGNFTREATRQELINKINEMQKEIENLKEINKEHQKLNGELREEIKRQGNIREIEEKYIEENFISKDEIREKIKELEGQEDWYIENKSLDDLYGRIDELKELLEGE